MEAESPEEFGYDRIRANLAESSCRDRTLSELGVDLSELLLLYGDHRGVPELRDAIAADAGVGRDDVLIANGAAMALFLVAITLLGPDDHLVVVRPNYATNLETPFAIGCAVTPIDLRIEEGFDLDLDRLAAAIRPETKLVSVTTPHNPTGVELAPHTLAALIRLCEQRGVFLLVDETYREMADDPKPVAAGLSSVVISVSSVSKTYGVPGIRTGWVIARNAGLMSKMLAAKEQIVLTGSVIDEHLALAVLRKRDEWLPAIRAHISAQRELFAAWIADEPRLAWVRPTGGVVAFPRIVGEVDTDVFYRHLLDAGVFVGPGRWFDQDPRHFRIGWGWPTREELTLGLDAISDALDRATPRRGQATGPR